MNWLYVKLYVDEAAPDIISSMGEGAKAGGEDLQEVEKLEHLRLILLLVVLLNHVIQRYWGWSPFFLHALQLCGQLHLHPALLCLDLSLCHSVTVRRVAIVAYPFLGVGHAVAPAASLSHQLFAVLARLRAYERLDGHAAYSCCVAGVAVVAAQQAVIVVSRASVGARAVIVVHAAQVDFVKQVFIETRVLVHGVVHLAIAAHVAIKAEAAIRDR